MKTLAERLNTPFKRGATRAIALVIEIFSVLLVLHFFNYVTVLVTIFSTLSYVVIFYITRAIDSSDFNGVVILILGLKIAVISLSFAIIDIYFKYHYSDIIEKTIKVEKIINYNSLNQLIVYGDESREYSSYTNLNEIGKTFSENKQGYLKTEKVTFKTLGSNTSTTTKYTYEK